MSLPPASIRQPAVAPTSGSPLVARAPVRIWDLPTRIFHWTLALAVAGQFTTAWLGWMEWHFRIGYTILALLLFRLVWGLIGGHWSRFSSFWPSPSSLMSYLRARSTQPPPPGHNPLGALSVWAMLVFLVAQVSTGLFSDDEIAAAGPLTRFVSNTVVGSASSWHTGPGKVIVLALVVLHVLAIAYYVMARRQVLVQPMVSGDALAPRQTRPSRDDAVSRSGALVLFVACAALAFWIGSLRA